MSNKEVQRKIDGLPLRPGVYIYKDTNGTILYVGKSKRLRDRVKSYFMDSRQLGPKTRRLVQEIADIDYIETESEMEALLLESDLIKTHKPPFNVQWKDDKRYKYIKITNYLLRKRSFKKAVENEIWPEVTTSRTMDDKKSIYFGPFPEGKTVNSVLRSLRKIFPWCKYSSKAQALRNKRPCFYAHIGLCPGICNDEFELRSYWEIMDQLVLFLQGKKHEVRLHYEQLMQAAADEERFEDAARYRDTLQRIDYVTQEYKDSNEYIENPNLVEDLRTQELGMLLSAISYPMEDVSPDTFYIEGYDISNIGSEYTTASRVAFVGGQPDKNLYRKYRITVEDLPNDYAAMQEVLTRRFKKKDDLPHLILIDGGKGQLSSALEIREKSGVSVPMVGLAKREEILIVPKNGGYEEVRLPHSSPAVKLIQRVRDESHRFAKKYHKQLRNKGMFESKS